MGAVLGNPFTIKVIHDPDDFCNRIDEIQKLMNYAENNTNMVLFSPRRYGKTSLARLVQKNLNQKGFITLYIDLFGLTSIDNIAGRITKGVYQGIHAHKTLMKRALDTIKTFRPVMRPGEEGISISVEAATQNTFGADLLDRTMEDLGKFIAGSSKKVNIVFDEFQEITKVGDSTIEGLLRAHIQGHQASYFFIGSRRRVLLEMFNQKRRPFFQSAVNVQLNLLPHEEVVAFIQKKFEAGGKKCSLPLANKIAEFVSDHPYYTQKLSLFVYDTAARSIKNEDLDAGYKTLLADESYVFETIVQSLAPQQIALLKAIARDSSKSVLSTQYMKKHGLKSIGGVQAALRKLTVLDYVEKNKEGIWKIVDPVFEQWLNVS
jgi:hypothetical protein